MEHKSEKYSEKEIKEYSAFLDSIMDYSPFAMWIANPEGTIIRTNKSLLKSGL